MKLSSHNKLSVINPDGSLPGDEGRFLNDNTTTPLHWLDWVVITAYFSAVMGIGFYTSYRRRKSQSAQGYFLASRSMFWLPVGASLFASNIGSGHFIGLAGSGAASGIGIATFELNAIFILLILGWLFLPVYMASGVYTMPEYLRLRFGGQRIRTYFAVLALILYIFTKISADLYAGALFIQLALGYSGDQGLYISIFILLIIAAIFTIAGGLTAAMWTDIMQTTLMIVGAFILMGLSFHAVGGYQELLRRYMDESDPSYNISLKSQVTNQSCGAVPDYALHLLRGLDSDLPWPGVIFGMTISSIWYWCSDQVIVQRALASKDLTNAKGGVILAGSLKLLPLFLLVFPGMAARVLYTDRVACATPEICKKVCGSGVGCTNIAYAELVLHLMPMGFSGLMLAVMMAALMSSLTSIFNSSSTIFTIDVWSRIRKNPTDKELIIVGRSSVLVLLAISIIWVPILQSFNVAQLFVYIQSVSNFLSPPVTAVFFLAVFWERTNEPGAFWGLMVGLVLGMFKFILEFSFAAPQCGFEHLDRRPAWARWIVDEMHYLHYGCILFLITLGVSITVSFLTPPMDPEKLYRLTFWTRKSPLPRKPVDEPDEALNRKIKKSRQDNGSFLKAKGYGVEVSKSSKELKRLEASCIKKNESELPIEPNAEEVAGSQSQLNHGHLEDDAESQINMTSSSIRNPEEEKAIKYALKALDEDPYWGKFVNWCAIILMIVAMAFWIYYA